MIIKGYTFTWWFFVKLVLAILIAIGTYIRVSDRPTVSGKLLAIVAFIIFLKYVFNGEIKLFLEDWKSKKK